MKTIKLMDLLQTFTKRELSGIHNYLRSPLFNKNNTLASFFKGLVSPAPHYLKKHPNWEKLFTKLFPRKKYNDTDMRRLRNDLYNQSKDYLALDGYLHDEYLPQLLLLQQLRRKGVVNEFDRICQQTRKDFAKRKNRSAVHHYYQFALNQEYAHYLTQQPGRINVSFDFTTAGQNLDRFYIIHKLRLICSILNFKQLREIDHQPLFKDEILTYVAQSSFEDSPAIQIYYTIYQTLAEPDEPLHYERLSQLLDKHIHRFSNEEGWEMYTYAFNFCIRKAQEGQQAYLKEIFRLYQSAFEHELMLVNNNLLPSHYKNIVNGLLQLAHTEQELKGVQQIIEQYKAKLATEDRAEVYAFCMALFHFHTRQYGLAAPALSQLSFDDPYFELDRRVLLLRMYMMDPSARDADFTLAFIKSFKVYLKRNKPMISDKRYQSYDLLLKLLQRLVRCYRTFNESKRVDQLIKFREELAPRFKGHWLLELVEVPVS